MGDDMSDYEKASQVIDGIGNMLGTAVRRLPRKRGRDRRYVAEDGCLSEWVRNRAARLQGVEA